MNTEQTAIVVSGAVGIAAVLAPSLTAWATRAHERKQARADRLYAQRHGAYLELGRFLERQRLTLELTERPFETPGEPPDPLATDAWIDMRARWTILASKAVREKLDAAAERFGDFVAAVLMARSFDAIAVGDDAPKLPEVMAKVDEVRDAALAAIAEAEEQMNTELVEL